MKIRWMMTGKIEREIRALVRPVETRADGEKMTVAGYAAVFGQETDIAEEFIEVIEPGAFKRSINGEDVLALYQHNPCCILGRKSAGTLRLKEDNKGLAVEIDLPNTTNGRDVRELIHRGDISGMSFGFYVPDTLSEKWDFSVEPPRRRILNVELYEVSIVANPAYSGTSVALRSRDNARAASEIRSILPASRLRMKVGIDLALRK
ncbi:HK97 family phage prohead protease [Agrobacterium radiobacter]|uniref:HK97 family phage prohead protease n=1 Tax=Agrobacterium radiobacter TaxID=362 RepID=UPI003F8763DC